MKLSHLIIGSTFLLSMTASPVFAEVNIMNEMVTTQDHIIGLDKVLNQVKTDTGTTPEFPAFIPKTNKKYYASNDASSKQGGFTYMINIDSTADCNGVKYCNVGRVSARADAKIDMMKDKSNKDITKAVDLADGTKAYYTPGHAMGDFFPASIQWLDNKMLYMITWNVEAKNAQITKDALITMANSAKHPGSG